MPEYAKLQKKAEKSSASAAVFLEQSLRDVSDLCQDSRKVAEGSVFVAIRGHSSDGHKFLAEVALKKPSALVVEESSAVPGDFQGLVLVVPSGRRALDQLSTRFYGEPSRKLLMFGVTGTNGKTSCSYLIEHILQKVRIATGVIGTIDHHFRDQVWKTGNTTPGALELQQRLAEMLAAGAKAVAMEVTSHALDQSRVDSVEFNVVMFTNLTLDHLDYHGTMEKYFAAKQKLFTDLVLHSRKVPISAVVNLDDEWGQRLRVSHHAHIWTYGQNPKADFSFKVLKGDFNQSEVQLMTPFGSFKAVLPLCGDHSVSNAVGAMTACAAIGIPVSASFKALADFKGVPGRLQSVPNSAGLSILIDYAHTPDALSRVLDSLQKVRSERKLTGRIHTVFGCGGDRDKSKRPLMAQIAEEKSDAVIVTSDNPRTEDPLLILEDIRKGFVGKKAVFEPDRKKAILLAVATATAGDVILIAGKGHEDYQEIGNQRMPFSDFQVVQEALR